METRKKIIVLKKELVEGLPYLGSILFGIPIIFNNNLSDKLMSTDGDTIYVNKSIEDTLKKEIKDGNINKINNLIAGIMVHELFHILLRHHLRIDLSKKMFFLFLDELSKIFNEPLLNVEEKKKLFNSYGFKIWNFATDYAVNGIIIDNQIKVETTDNILELPKNCLYNIKYKDLSADVIYLKLLEEEKNILQNIWNKMQNQQKNKGQQQNQQQSQQQQSQGQGQEGQEQEQQGQNQRQKQQEQGQEGQEQDQQQQSQGQGQEGQEQEQQGQNQEQENLIEKLIEKRMKTLGETTKKMIDKHYTPDEIRQIKKAIDKIFNKNAGDVTNANNENDIIDTIENRIQEAILNAEREIKYNFSFGNTSLPSYLQEIFSKKEVISNVFQQLQNLVSTYLVKGEITNMRYPNKRYINAVKQATGQEIYFADKKQEKCDLTVLLDVSGSISRDDINNFLNMLEQLLKSKNINKVRIIQFDSEVVSDMIFESKTGKMSLSDILLNNNFFARYGSGGTNFNAGVKYLLDSAKNAHIIKGKDKHKKREMPKLVLLVSGDGNGSMPEYISKKLPFKLVWLIDKKNISEEKKEELRKYGFVCEYTAYELSKFDKNTKKQQHDNDYNSFSP